MTIQQRDLDILKARVYVNRINQESSVKSEQWFEGTIKAISKEINKNTLIRNLSLVASGSTLYGAHFELKNMIGKVKNSQKETDIKMFRFAMKVWLAESFNTTFAISDFFATHLFRTLSKEDFQDIIDAMYDQL